MFIRKYQLVSPLGEGKFGQVYRGNNRKTGEEVAVKLESRYSHCRVLRHESTLLHYLSSKACANVPPVYWYGEWTEKSAMVLVMPLYEYSLYEFATSRNMSASSYTNILASCLRIYESIHVAGVVHRDVKPQNIMHKQGQWYIIDFGLSSFYVNEDFRHISSSTVPVDRHMVGTPKYASWFMHQGYEYSRRDDLLSLGYVGLWFLYGDRFWERIAPDEYLSSPLYSMSATSTELTSPNNERLARCKEKNRVFSHLVDYPNLRNYLEYAYSLAFDETPPYSAMEECLLQSETI